MNERLYGPMDPDSTLLEAVRAFALERGATDLLVAMKARQPWDARPCQYPGSLLIDFQINNDKAYAARQHANGKIEWLGL